MRTRMASCNETRCAFYGLPGLYPTWRTPRTRFYLANAFLPRILVTFILEAATETVAVPRIIVR
jgi:hypothetical protein